MGQAASTSQCIEDSSMQQSDENTSENVGPVVERHGPVVERQGPTCTSISNTKEVCASVTGMINAGTDAMLYALMQSNKSVLVYLQDLQTAMKKIGSKPIDEECARLKRAYTSKTEFSDSDTERLYYWILFERVGVDDVVTAVTTQQRRHVVWDICTSINMDDALTPVLPWFKFLLSTTGRITVPSLVKAHTMIHFMRNRERACLSQRWTDAANDGERLAAFDTLTDVGAPVAIESHLQLCDAIHC